MCALNRSSRVWLLVTPWTVAPQAPLSHGIFPGRHTGQDSVSSGFIPQPEIKATSLESPALAGGLFTTEPPEAQIQGQRCKSLSEFKAVAPISPDWRCVSCLKQRAKFTLPLPFVLFKGLGRWMVPTYTGIPGASIGCVKNFFYLIISQSLFYILHLPVLLH